MIPGELLPALGDIELNAGRPTIKLKVGGISGGFTVEQWVSIGTFALGVITGLGGLLVGWRTATATQRPPDPSPGAA